MIDSPSHGLALPKAGLRELPVLEGSLRVGPLVGVPALLEELGVDLAAVIGPLGLVETLFSDAENMIAFPILGWAGFAPAAASQPAPPADAAAYDAALRQRVAAFQLSAGLKPDGLAGPTTYMLLNRALAVDEPRLARE